MTTPSPTCAICDDAATICYPYDIIGTTSGLFHLCAQCDTRLYEYRFGTLAETVLKNVNAGNPEHISVGYAADIYFNLRKVRELVRVRLN